MAKGLTTGMGNSVLNIHLAPSSTRVLEKREFGRGYNFMRSIITSNESCWSVVTWVGNTGYVG